RRSATEAHMFRAFLDMVDDIGWGRALGSVLLFALCAGVLVGLVTLTSRLVERRISSRGLGLTVRGVLGLILGAADGILFSYFVQYVWEGRVYLAVSLAMGVFGAVFGLLLGVGWTGKGVKFGAAACSFILLGAFLLTVPEFRARPDTLSVTDALPGLG